MRSRRPRTASPLSGWARGAAPRRPYLMCEAWQSLRRVWRWSQSLTLGIRTCTFMPQIRHISGRERDGLALNVRPADSMGSPDGRDLGIGLQLDED